MKVTSALAVLISAFMLAAVPALASETHELTGTVVSAGGDPVVDAVVNLPELRRQTTTDEEGRFTFRHLPDGEYLISVNSPRFGGAVQRVRPVDLADVTRFSPSTILNIWAATSKPSSSMNLTALP